MSFSSLKSTLATALLSLSLVNAIPTTKVVARDSVKGFDISHYQPNVDYDGAYAGGIVFALIKATESTSYTDPSFSGHYKGTYDAGMVRGAYHFAQPGDSSGADQANFFLENGGAWSADGKTLPGMLDLEADCSSMSSSEVVSWIQDFVDTYQGSTGRYPILYLSPSWWSECTGDSSAFGDTCPLHMACWNDSPCDAPGGWSTYTIWQYADTNTYGGDSDEFNGSMDQLTALATDGSNATSSDDQPKLRWVSPYERGITA